MRRITVCLVVFCNCCHELGGGNSAQLPISQLTQQLQDQEVVLDAHAMVAQGLPNLIEIRLQLSGHTASDMGGRLAS